MHWTTTIKVVSMTRLKSLAEQEPTDVTKGPSKKKKKKKKNK